MTPCPLRGGPEELCGSSELLFLLPSFLASALHAGRYLSLCRWPIVDPLTRAQHVFRFWTTWNDLLLTAALSPRRPAALVRLHDGWHSGEGAAGL